MEENETKNPIDGPIDILVEAWSESINGMATNAKERLMEPFNPAGLFLMVSNPFVWLGTVAWKPLIILEDFQQAFKIELERDVLTYITQGVPLPKKLGHQVIKLDDAIRLFFAILVDSVYVGQFLRPSELGVFTRLKAKIVFFENLTKILGGNPIGVALKSVLGAVRKVISDAIMTTLRIGAVIFILLVVWVIWENLKSEKTGNFFKGVLSQKGVLARSSGPRSYRKLGTGLK